MGESGHISKVCPSPSLYLIVPSGGNVGFRVLIEGSGGDGMDNLYHSAVANLDGSRWEEFGI